MNTNTANLLTTKDVAEDCGKNESRGELLEAWCVFFGKVLQTETVAQYLRTAFFDDVTPETGALVQAAIKVLSQRDALNRVSEILCEAAGRVKPIEKAVAKALERHASKHQLLTAYALELDKLRAANQRFISFRAYLYTQERAALCSNLMSLLLPSGQQHQIEEELTLEEQNALARWLTIATKPTITPPERISLYQELAGALHFFAEPDGTVTAHGKYHTTGSAEKWREEEASEALKKISLLIYTLKQNSGCGDLRADVKRYLAYVINFIQYGKVPKQIIAACQPMNKAHAKAIAKWN